MQRPRPSAENPLLNFVQLNSSFSEDPSGARPTFNSSPSPFVHPSRGPDDALSRLRLSRIPLADEPDPIRHRTDRKGRRPIIEAVNEYNDETNLQWVPRTTQMDYVDFTYTNIPGEGYAEIGDHGGEQYVFLGAALPTCGVLHEMGHVLGLMHEQERLDASQKSSLTIRTSYLPMRPCGLPGLRPK